MIMYISNDIIRVEAELLINASNGQGYMGGFIGKYIRLQGVAESIHFADSSIEKKAKQICRSVNSNLGDIFHTSAGKLPFYKGILHAITMNKPGQKSSLATIEKCLINITAYCQNNDIKTVAIPLLGCGTGRLHKPDVISLYEKYLDSEETIFIIVNK